VDALLDDTSLKLGEGAADAEDQLPHEIKCGLLQVLIVFGSQDFLVI
jgi:hypothetical protein